VDSVGTYARAAEKHYPLEKFVVVVEKIDK
jgi:hypothetical protein